MFFERRDVGRIYVVRMELPDGVIVHKIGMCNSNRSVDRMMEILRSWFTRFRFVPYTELKLDMNTNYPKQLESHIHKILNHKRFTPHMEVEGRTEMFNGIDELRVLHYIRTFNEDLVPTLKLSDEDYKNLGQLISP
jgi:hypothetical protein